MPFSHLQTVSSRTPIALPASAWLSPRIRQQRLICSPTVSGESENSFGLWNLSWSLAHDRKAMDEWGYNYRLGSTRAWFEQDAEDARNWLCVHQLIDERDKPLMKRRET